MKIKSEIVGQLIVTIFMIVFLVLSFIKGFGISNMSLILLFTLPMALIIASMFYFIAVRQVSWVKVFLVYKSIFVLAIIIVLIIGIIAMIMS